MNFRFVIFLGLFALTGAAKSVTEILDSLFVSKAENPKGYYDKRIPPSPNGAGVPLKVVVSTYVLDLWNVDEKKHEFTAQLYFRQKWVDQRLVFQPPTGVQYISLDAEYSKRLWTPDTFIVNERSAEKHELTVENVFTRIASDGEVLQSRRITVTGSCKMNLKWFPFDQHICSLVFESYGYTANDFYYEWKGTPGVSAGAGGSINQEVRAVRATNATVALNSGSYCRVGVEFLIARVSTRFFQDVYFPSVVLVTVAFITMSVGALQFRVLLSVICMVAMILFTSLLSMEMPKVSYQTALDFYVFKCSFMIFNVVLVNFILYHLLKPSNTVNSRVRMRRMNGHADTDEAKEILDEPSEDFNIGRPSFDSRFKEIVYKLCMYSQYTMPCFFILFNIIYWMVVLIGSSSVGDDVDFMLLENTE